MIISVHQPQYLPWLGYIDKIKKSDVFVYLDNVQYKKREFQNRNKIRTEKNWIWLSIPVITKSRFEQKIKEVKIDPTQENWQKKHWESINLHYHKARFFKKYEHIFKGIYDKKWEFLIDINIATIDAILHSMNITRKIYYESDLNIEATKTKRIIEICKKLNADTYLSGIGAKDYIIPSEFEKENIKLIYQNFTHPTYKQVYDGFFPYMSTIDFLFNCGVY